MVWIVDLVESARCARKQHDPRLGLENLAQPPARVLVHHVPEHHVQVLDHQHEPLALAIRKIEQGRQAAVLQRLVIVNGAQLVVGTMQVRAIFPVWRLDSETGQAFQPELSRRGHLVALLGEHNRKEGG